MSIKNKVLSILFALFLISLSIISCTIGLGEAVDTQPPVPSITYPPAASVVRGIFVLAGNCNDDVATTSVDITIKNLDTQKTYAPKEAVIVKNKWTVEMKNEESEDGLYPDGTYSFSAIAKDKAGHSSGIASTSFKIDNTAPVVILSKPLAKGDDVATKFGKTLSISGDVSDDNKLAKLVMTLKPETKDSAGNTVLGEPIYVEVTDITGISSDNPLHLCSWP